MVAFIKCIQGLGTLKFTMNLYSFVDRVYKHENRELLLHFCCTYPFPISTVCRKFSFSSETVHNMGRQCIVGEALLLHPIRYFIYHCWNESKWIKNNEQLLGGYHFLSIETLVKSWRLKNYLMKKRVTKVINNNR